MSNADAIYLLADSASADYLWPCLADAMQEFSGTAVGLTTLRRLESERDAGEGDFLWLWPVAETAFLLSRVEREDPGVRCKRNVHTGPEPDRCVRGSSTANHLDCGT